jgi:HSP20 family protein
MEGDPLDEIERVFGLMSEQFGVQRSAMPVDLVDTGETYVIEIDLPGYDTADIDVRLTENQRVQIRASRQVGGVDGTYVRHERKRPGVDQTISLPEPVEADEPDAAYESGVLTIRLDKQQGESDEGTEIPVA